MSIHVGLSHFTRYQFDRPVGVGPHLVRLRPAPHSRTPVVAYSLKVKPEKHFINWQQDPFGNYVARLVFPEKTDELSFAVDLIADMTVINPFDFFLEESAQHFPLLYDEELAKELAPYLEVKENGPLLARWLQNVDRARKPTVDFLVDLNSRLRSDIGYVIRMEPGIQTCEETLGSARGSCRDSGWLLVQILRHLGLAARFVSGYLVQLTADLKSLDGPSGPAQDFTDLHAWTEVFVPGAGWLGLDPTSGLFAGEGHIPLAATPDPAAAAPVTGSTDECRVEFHFHNHVRRVREDPRVTKPYSEHQWLAIDHLGSAIDADLAAGDVRLTMGGEPTFVSIDDMDGAEWNTASMGPNKRHMAATLLRALWQRFGPNGVLQYGQGKWYPGEALPRWALSCFWRRDGEALWREPSLLADETGFAGRDIGDAEQFIGTLAGFLGLTPELAVPGYEDALYYMWKEGSLPINVDPLKAGVDEPEERRRLATLLSRGLSAVTGYALPLRWQDDSDGGNWHCGPWHFRRGRMHLLPGSSAMGYRLPLESLVFVDPKDKVFDPEPSPFAPRAPLASRHATPLLTQRQGVAAEKESAARSRRGGAHDDVIRTSLCVEPRDGRLYVFLPPLQHLEAFVDLIECVEATAAQLRMPIILEGYEPPRDPRLQRLQITPDPGVIEVNIHPSSNWHDLKHVTETIYEEARQCRLGTEKFMLDGRHTGTGGGNHMTIGGPTPADSPVLRRPDLLQSLVTYWQHHPSLSFLFSGLFIGPTSQAPRVDEARDDSLYELEIAFSRVPRGEVPQAWLVDRLMRHLLVDSTGNTHRAEFCIDKLYSPDSSTGRLGLLEMRAFEMPPHARMSLVQQLLLRGLVARFWRTPYRRELVRWGTEVHDRFMLPHYLWEDLREVVGDLRRDGYEFELDWFAPFLEFRFPRYGTINAGDVELELRMALEPWHVLGEEVSSQGTARCVDSSVERLQVKVSGLTPERHVIACNGRRVPLRSTGRALEAVAGVRYRAWQPPSALHPTIAVHTPLVFDIVDLWNGASIGGCTYHVGHPGGRNYDVYPVNAYEAEARRMARFWSYGHTPGTVPAPPEERSLEFPYTLDLRRTTAC
jgi:uncharacterized protein (DUF2126 family)/transglutaminase-like putative cysteine protease